MRRCATAGLAAGLVLALTAASAALPAAPDQPTPGVTATYMATLQLPKAGWAKTAGGRGGRIIRVTTLAAAGPAR